MGKGNPHNVNKLYGTYDEDIYILGSGSMLDHFSKEFFANKIVIGLNNIYKFFPCTYILTHHHAIAQEMINSGITTIVSKHNISHAAHPEHDFEGSYYYYEHNTQGFARIDLTEFGDVICAAGTPVVAAMQIAMKLGARNIMLCGVDGGWLDKRYNYKEYPLPTQNGHPGRVQSVINEVAKKIRENGVGVCSVIPFVNLTLEGHDFQSDNGSWATRRWV